jgi:malonyl-CoA/methylmalonyl-CoA synthetase
MQLTDLFDVSLLGRRDEVALELEGTDGVLVRLTFGELDGRARRMAGALAARGLAPGDRVALHLPNCLEFIDLLIACVRSGYILVPVNVLYRERELAHIVADAEPALVVTSDDHASLFPAGTPLVTLDVLATEARSGVPIRERTSLAGDDPVALVYTSGTTGQSKGAVLTHNNVMSNTANLLACWRITSADRYLAVLPLFHVHGLVNGACCWLASGCLMRLEDRFHADRAAAWFRAFQPTLFYGVPTIYVRLLELDPAMARRLGQGMRLFVSGSAPLPAAVLEKFRERFGHTILERYGMSETLMLTSNLYAGERRAGTVGCPLPGTSLVIRDDSGSTLTPGEIGQVHVRGPTVCAGYWRNADATAAAFREGWFTTGDLGSVDADGRLTLHGRASDLIISGGFNVYPREIEAVLLEEPGVREAAVVGAPDDRRGEVPVAFVVADDDVDLEALRHRCAGALASFKAPRAVIRIDALPRNALGKVQKHRLPLPTATDA